MKKTDALNIFKKLVFLYFTAMGIIICLIAYDMFFEFSEMQARHYLVAIVFAFAVIHFLIGIGVSLENKLAYYAVKQYLYLALIAVPIGTYLSLKILKFINKYSIDSEF